MQYSDDVDFVFVVAVARVTDGERRRGLLRDLDLNRKMNMKNNKQNKRNENHDRQTKQEGFV